MNSIFDQSKLTITLKTVFGLEPALEQNLQELGYTDYQVLNRAVQLIGNWEDVYFLNLNVRCAISVLVEMVHFHFDDKDELYKNVRSINWPEVFHVNKTFAIRGFVSSSLFPNTQFPMLLAKDALVDDFRARTGIRPNVDLKNAQIVLDLHIQEKHCTISLNTSGDPLFKRGYRSEAGIAPLNEVVAAGLIYLSGWDRKSAFVDPMCGSGTLAIEAAMISSNTPAGILRNEFTFMHLSNFDRNLWNHIYESSKAKMTKVVSKIFASDQSDAAVNKARRNIRALPFARNIELAVCDFSDVKKPESTGVVITNPPYGERIGDHVEELYKELGDWMKQQMTGYDCWVLSSNIDALKSVGLKHNKTIKLFNGSLPCDFKKYSIFDGSRNKNQVD